MPQPLECKQDTMSRADDRNAEVIGKNINESQTTNTPDNAPLDGTKIDDTQAGFGPESDVVDWDGENDPENPMHWPNSKKWTNIATVSILTILTPLGSSMFAPGIPAILEEFHEDSEVAATFLMSVYILGFAFGPLLVAPLSEIYGRRPLYIYGNILFVIFTIATALSQSIGMLIAFRLFMGLIGSVPVTIGSGTIADMMPVEKRGRAMSAWAMGPLLGPCIGPVAGGFLIQATSWRWVYWLISMLGGILMFVSYFFLSESSTAVLLEKKAENLRKATGNLQLRSKLDAQVSAKQKVKDAILRPLRLLVLTPVVTLMAVYLAINYGILNLLITTFSFVYPEQYGFEEGTTGVTFLPAGLGMMIGVLGFGQLTDLNVRRNQARGIAHRPEVRLTPFLTIPSGLSLPTGLFIYGWTTQNHVHWIVPMIGVLVYTTGMMGLTVSAKPPL
ncbi:hypothetical protein NW762_004057 [Fusarium torreyae]|uniref:Major facilitator superfamily (MFS) profile domain-containing protein n=1 Tax=Fusarium torreyae TaxID=1237075 RepID=A0A9W8S735_9HYPO|nr:hypothetical protein NW762_004057 [Fusarium torreyae]